MVGQVKKLHEGKVIGRWTLLQFLGWDKGGKTSHWLARCSCGITRRLSSPSLYQGASLSCGCAMIEQKSTKGGVSKKWPKQYAVYKAMLSRCYNPKNRAYKNYGGRGITVCDSWKANFENFMADMGQPPEGMTLDRVNNDGPYCKENCQWASKSQQARNTRLTRWVEIKGSLVKLRDLADRLGIKVNTLISRLDLYGMEIDQAIAIEVSPEGSVAQKIKRAERWSDK